MGYELTGNSISSTYARLVQHVSDNYYDGAGNILGIVSDTSLQNYVAKAGDAMTGNLTINASLFVNGNVGIGTTEPFTALHIISDGTTSSMIRTDAGMYINIVNRPPAFSVSLAGEGTGNVNAGLHNYYISYSTSLGDTELTGKNGASTAGGDGGEPITTTSLDGKVNVSVTASTDYRVNGIKIYRNKVIESIGRPLLVTTLTNETQIWQDNIPDSSLTGDNMYNSENKTNKQILINDEPGIFIGGSSTIIGKRAGRSITSGGSHTLLGFNAGANITTGVENNLIGRYAGGAITTSSYNTAIGGFANYNSPGNNIAIGYNALMRNQLGTNNVAIGIYAGRFDINSLEVTNVANSTYVGTNIRCSSTTYVSNEIAIGYATYGNGSNSVTIGNNNITKTILKGNVGIGTTDPTAALDVSTGDAASGAILGNAFAGVWNGNTNYAAFCHKNQRYNTNNYAFIQSSSGSSWFNAAAAGQLSFNIGAGGKMKLFSSGGFSIGSTFYNMDPGSNNLAVQGKIGIGTATPAATLDVSGNVNIDGSLYINSGGVTVKGNTTNDRLVVDTGLNFTPVARPAGSTIDVSVLPIAGNVTAGTHHYSYSFVTPLGETEVMSSMPVGPYTFDASHGQAVLTVPVSTDYRVTRRKIYRTYANTYGYTIFLLATINDNTTTTYTDNLADAALTGAAAYYRPNTTSEYVTINGTRAMLFADTLTLVGKGAGLAVVTGGGNLNTFIGVGAGAGVTSGAVNTALGYNALNKCTTSGGNAAIGEMAAYNVTGTNNTVVGTYALCGITGAVTGGLNVVIGRGAGYNVTGGFSSNTVLGYGAGYNASGNNNIFLGYNAGNYSTAGNRLIIDSITRADASAEIDSALIYGIMSTTPANQILKLGGGGKVGVNTITPAATLDVSGSFNVNGNIYVDGSVGFTGDVSVGQTMRFKNGILIQVL